MTMAYPTGYATYTHYVIGNFEKMKTSILIIISLVLASCSNQPNKPVVLEKNGSYNKSSYEWDFNSNKIYEYNYSLEETSEINWEGEIDKTNSENNGRIEVISSNNSTADLLIFNDAKTNPLLLPHQRKFNKKVKPIAVQEIKSSGNIEELFISANLIQANYFVLPKSDIQKGQKESINIPIEIMGSNLLAKGIISIENHSKINDSIILFKSTLKISELRVPEKLDFTASIDITGDGQYLFNIVENRFESSNFKISRNISLYRINGKTGQKELVHQTKNDLKVSTKFDEK